MRFYRIIRKLSLLILIFLIIFMGFVFYNTQRRIVSKLNGIILLENERIHSWMSIFRLAGLTKESFSQIIVDNSSDVSGVMQNLELLEKELKKLKNSPYAIDRDNAAYLKRAQRKFKSAVLGHKRDVESGYYGISQVEMEKLGLIAAEQILDLSYRAEEDVFKFIDQRNRNIMQEFKKANKVLAVIFILGVGIVLFILFIQGATLNRIMDVFTIGMQHLAKGEFNFRIKGRFDKDVQKLAGIFNKMADDFEIAEGKVNKAYKVLDKVTGNLNDGIMLLSNDLKVEWFNKKITEEFGQKETEIIGKYCYNIIHNSAYPCSEQDKCPLKKTNERRGMSATVQTLYDHKGVSFYAECILFPLIDAHSEIEEYIYIIRDISERVILEQKMENNISALLATRLNLEKRMKELEKIHKITVDRELRMVVLKKRIAELESAANNR